MSRSPFRIGNAPCSWGSFEFGDASDREIGYEQMLDELAETGYTGTELGDWRYMPTDPPALRSELERRDLSMIGAFVPVAFADAGAHEAGEAHALKVARLLADVAAESDADIRPVVVLADDNGSDPIRRRHAGRVTPEMMLDNDSWAVFAAGVERIARRVRSESGLESTFHPHCAGFVETPDEIAQLLDRTDPDLVGLVFDTGHYAFGAGGCGHVQDGFRRFGHRIRHVHFKDCSADVASRARAEDWDYFEALKHGVFCELGKGCVDFPEVVRLLREISYNGWIVVEQDVLPGMGTPRESAARNRAYLRSIGL